MTSIPPLLAATIMTAYTRLPEDVKLLYALELILLSSDMSVWALQDLAYSIPCGRNLSLAFFLWPVFGFSWYLPTSAFPVASTERLSTSFLIILTTSTVQTGRLIARFTTLVALYILAMLFCTARSTTVCMAELEKALETEWLTTVRITAITSLYGLKSVSRPALQKHHTMLCSH